MFDIDLYSLTLAQDGGPPSLNEEGAGTGGGLTGAPGSPTGTGSSSSPFGGNFLMLFLLVIVGMLVFSIYGQRRDRKKREAVLSSITKHDRVQTIGGVIGSVIEVKPNVVVLKVDEASNTRMTFARSAIQQVLSEKPEQLAAESQ